MCLTAKQCTRTKCHWERKAKVKELHAFHGKLIAKYSGFAFAWNTV